MGFFRSNINKHILVAILAQARELGVFSRTVMRAALLSAVACSGFGLTIGEECASGNAVAVCGTQGVSDPRRSSVLIFVSTITS